MKNPLGKHQATSRCNLDSGHVLQRTGLVMDEPTDKTDDFISYCNEEISTTGWSVRRGIELKQYENDITDGIHTRVEQDHGILKDLLKESLDGIYHELEEIKRNNKIQFRKIDKKNKEKLMAAEKRLKKIIRK